MNRRSFLRNLLAASAAVAVDPERLVWTRSKLISIPKKFTMSEMAIAWRDGGHTFFDLPPHSQKPMREYAYKLAAHHFSEAYNQALDNAIVRGIGILAIDKAGIHLYPTSPIRVDYRVRVAS